MEITKELLLKSISTVLLVLFILFFIKFVNLSSLHNGIKKEYEKTLKEQIKKSELKIKKFTIEVERKELKILQLEKKQKHYEHSLDSLKLVKQKINTVYREKIIKVKNFNSLEIEDYWRNKFNSEFYGFLLKTQIAYFCYYHNFYQRSNCGCN